jgi:hypothetical protein
MKYLIIAITWLISWTATGDDGMIGRSSLSILQVSRDSLFNLADTIPTPIPSPAGEKDSVYYGAIYDTVYLRIFHVDDRWNISPPSNLAYLINPPDIKPVSDLTCIGPSNRSKGVAFSFTIPDSSSTRYYIRQFEEGTPTAKRMWKYPGFTEDYVPRTQEGVRDTFVLSISANSNKEYTYLLYRESDYQSSRSSNRCKLWVGISIDPCMAIADSDTTWRAWIDKGLSFSESSLGKCAFYSHKIWDESISYLVTWRDIQLRYYWQIWRIYGYVYLPN